MSNVTSDAHAVLLPAIDHLTLTPELLRYFDNGGKALLLGENREEYVSRRMAPNRVQMELPKHFTQIKDAVLKRAGSNLIAIDLEPAGIQRLHKLIPTLPSKEVLQSMTSDEIESVSGEIGLTVRKLGINMALGPIVDVVTGSNGWLEGRTLGTDVEEVGRIAAAFIKGLQNSGIVATAKHFPGHADITGDPAIQIAEVPGTKEALEGGYLPFRVSIKAGVKAIMTGPCRVPAVDSLYPSSLSEVTIRKLREEFGFRGLVVTDDLDAKSTLLDRTVAESAIIALRAGADLLLLAAEGQVNEVAIQIAFAVKSGELSEKRLREAAHKVRSLAESVS